jgi:hypothetical protein
VTAVIEAPLALLQKPVKVVWRDAIEPTQMSFCLVPEVLNPIDVMPSFRHKDFAVVNTSVVKF